MTTQEFWKTFLETTGRDPNTTYFECFHFTNEEQLANELLALVLSGKKRATSSSKLCYAEGEGPKPGYLSIVTDFAGNPHCVIETKAVQVIPFNEMTYEICSREGEDECLETWQEGHRHFFLMDCQEMGYEFTEDMPVVFEDFEVIYRI
ncbi:MAG TPA: ASCH domain-containing protein [Clostridia bacterium]|nr:ASCH domain-containing protein [Clostridia bacterium]